MRLEEAVSSAKKLADTLSSSELKPLFDDNNDTTVAITKLSDIFLSKLHNITNKNISATTDPQRVDPSLPRVNHTSTNRLPRVA